MIFALRNLRGKHIDWHKDLDGKGSRCLIAMDSKGMIVRLYDGITGINARFTGPTASVLERAADFIQRKTGVEVTIIAPVLTDEGGE